MVSIADFSWTEVGTRIRDWRHQRGMSQQALADAARLTQNGVFRLEYGRTNPQLSTLQQIASALGCSVRDLVAGSSETEPILAERFRRVRRVVEAGDEAALKAMDNGLETAEALLERSGGRRGLPPLNRKIIVKGEGRRSPAYDLFWMRGPHQRRSEADDQTVAQTVRKAGEPFRNSGTTHETKKKHERL
jgi:transcriptional regulator with XRE-family HTH domain